MAIGICESCGREEEVSVVRRVYVTPEAWDTEGKATTGDLESWCAPCQAHYPHQDPE